MKKVQIIFSILLFLIIPTRLSAQTKIVISDGIIGITNEFVNDTIFITKVEKGKPADLAGIKKEDILLEADGIKCSGSGLPHREIMYLISGSGGSTQEIKVQRVGVEEPIDLTIEFKKSLNIQTRVYFDYLADSGHDLSIDEILSDSVQEMFCNPYDGRKIIGIVEPGGIADEAGLLPGDKMININYWGNLDYWAEFDTEDFPTEDSILHVLRNDSLLKFDLDLREITDLGIKTKVETDLVCHSKWLRVIYTSNIYEDRTYLIQFLVDCDTIELFHRNSEGQFEVKRTGSSVERDQREFVFKNYPSLRVNIDKNVTDTLYLWVNQEQSLVYPYINMKPLDNLLKYDRAERLMIGLILGIIVIISIYYFMMFFLARDRSNIVYSLFALSIGLYLLQTSGYGYEILWSDSKFFDVFDEDTMAYFPFLLFGIFGLSYMNLRKDLRTWYKIIFVVVIVMAVSVTGVVLTNALFTSYKDWFAILWIPAAVCLLLISVVFIPPTVMKLKRGYKPGWYFLIGNIIFLLIFVYRVLFYPDLFSTSAEKIIYNSSIYLGVFLQFLVLSLGLIMRLRDTEKQKKLAQEKLILQLKENEILKDQVNKELEHKVQERTKEIEDQKNELMEKQQEITDSINYARRIQTAALPTEKVLSEILPEHFVLYKPKDIVSGDFYWIRQVKNYTVVVAADCTGHGVPGAFMSMLGVSLLNDQISSRRFDSAGEILNQLRRKVKETLNQEGREMEQKDGMDLGMAIIDNESSIIEFAGAFNPLFIIRSKTKEAKDLDPDYLTMDSAKYTLIEIKGDRQPIAIHSIEKDFTTKTIQLLPQDTIYLFSDGFPDQIGGPKQKKFMTKNFKRLLLSIQDHDLGEQKKVLENTLSDWRGDVQQVDDIIVFGIKWK